MKKPKRNEDTTPVSPVAVEDDNDTEITEVGAAPDDDDWDGPTREVAPEEVAALAVKSTTEVDIPVIEPTDDPTAVGPPDGGAAAAADGEAAEADGAAASADGTAPAAEAPQAPQAIDGEGEPEAVADPGRLENVIESLLFASDHPLTVNELKKLVGERDGAKITAAVTALQTARQETGINVISVAGGWHLRTNPTNVAWVSRLIAGKPQRLSRAMLETLAIVAYRQPITRPEVDDIRGVDCGPVLKTLLDRGLVRMIGKKEDVGRPILYGTTPEFLRTFSLRDLTELPTLREFHELGADEQAEVDAKAPRAEGEAAAPAGGTAAQEPLRPAAAPRRELDPEEDDELLSELERAAAAAAAASAQSAPAPEGEQPPPAPTDAPTGDTAAAPPPRSDG